MKRNFPRWLKYGIIAALIPLLGLLLEFIFDNEFVTAINSLIYDITKPAQAISFVITTLVGLILFGDSIIGVVFGSGVEPLTSIIGVTHAIFTIVFMFLFGALIGKLVDKFVSKKKSH